MSLAMSSTEYLYMSVKELGEVFQKNNIPENVIDINNRNSLHFYHPYK